MRGLSNSIRYKNEKLVKKIKRHLSFQVGNWSEEGFKKSLMLSVKKEEDKSSDNSEEYAQKVKEAWMNLRNLLGEANEEKKVFLKLNFLFSNKILLRNFMRNQMEIKTQNLEKHHPMKRYLMRSLFVV